MLDQLAEILASAEASKVFNVTFEFSDPAHAAAIEGFTSEELLEWMKVKGYADKAFELYFKSICRALSHDLHEFASESVRASVNGALTVAIALLRKPFKEDLFYIEWILADPDDFFAKFTAGDIDSVELRKIEPARKLEVIRRAMMTSPYSKWIEPEFIYELRFDKKSPIGLEPTWQKANHLITTKGELLRTERENFNFIFSDAPARDTQLLGFYATVPILLFHSIQMIEAMINMFARREAPDLVPLRTLAGMDLWMGSKSCALDLQDVQYRFHWVVAQTIRQLRCAKCNMRIRVTRRNCHSIFVEGKAPCNNCDWLMPLEVTQRHESSSSRRGP